MKIHGLLLAAAFLPVALAAQEDRYAQITNPKLTSINKEPPRSTFTSYTNEADAVVNDRKNGTFRISSTASGNSTMWRTSPIALPTLWISMQT